MQPPSEEASAASASNAEPGMRRAGSGQIETPHSAFRIPLFADDLARLLHDPELADDLRRARRLLRIDPPQGHEPLGLAALLTGDRAEGQAKRRRRKPRHARQRPSGGELAGRLWGAVTWLVVCAGGMALTFGAGLLACGLLLHEQFLGHEALSKRDDLWNWGLLTALAGQFVLFLGVALRLSSSRRSRASRPTVPPRGERPSSDAVRQPPPHTHTSAAPPWSSRCEAVLGLSLDSLDRA